MEPPSRQLQQVLLSNRLCSARELRRCAGRVRRLASDLPGFDSVWLDALVQRRVLTSFQARSIEANEHDQLTIGPSIALNLIGHGPDSETFLTRLPHERSTCIVKRVRIASELRGPTMKRLQRLVERGHDCQHAGVVIPHACREVAASAQSSNGHRTARSSRLETQARLAIVSRPAEGLTLAQMLLRRGRFPERMVFEIARQLIDAVAALHDARIVHGEIRLENLLLSSRGQLVLVDCGIRPAVRPAFEISAFVDPGRNDGVAPELIGTGDPATPSSDVYAIGCLLWQLLAGRPAHPTGDPLAKLAAHQTERIPDVRELAPETSARLAEAITWLTSPNAKDRPAQARDVLTGSATSKAEVVRPVLGQPGRRSRAVLSKFASGFHHPVARSRDPGRRPRTASRLVVASAAVLIAVGALHLFSGRTALPASIDQFGKWLEGQYSALTSSRGDVSSESLSEGAANPGSDSALSPLPEPSADGTIELTHSGPWEATPIVWSGARLSIKGRPDEPARIVVRDRAWQLRATEVSLENLQIMPANEFHPAVTESEAADESTVEFRSAVECQSQSLQMTGCMVHSAFMARERTEGQLNDPIHGDIPGTRHLAALRWQALDPGDPLAGQISFTDCRFIGLISTIDIASPARRIRCVNTLKLAGGPLFRIGPDSEPVSRTIELERVTVRDSSSVIAVRLPAAYTSTSSRLDVRMNHCVISLHGWGEEPQPGSLITYVGGRLAPDWFRDVAINGQDSVAGRSTSVVSRMSHDAMQRGILDDSRVSLRGLISTDIEFRGIPSFDPADSVVARIAANRRSSDLPGMTVNE